MVASEQFAVMPFREWIASAGTVELNSGVGGLSIDFMPTAPVTDRLPRHSIRISSNRGLYCILLYRFRCAFPGASAPA